MDLNKLKGRLNVKFEPIIQSQRKSLKKLQQLADPKQRQKQRQKQRHNYKNQDNPITHKIRSNSQIRLPSLHSHNRSKARHDTLEDSKSYINIPDLKQRAKSFKEIPKVKIQGKQAINNTITYLMKNQILNVPRLVALLQKNESDQFIYLKMTGIYEFEACDEREKGNSYVTVSKNGMVQNGELITLETLAREFQLWKKLKKIDYFRNYHYTKYLHKWKQANKRKRYDKNRQNLSRELHLKDRNYQEWKKQIFSTFRIKSEGGWVSETWIHKLTDSIRQTKEQARRRLFEICFWMLEPFNLPISESPDLLNRVLGNLSALNISFEKKIRIQKQCQRFYKLGRQLQLASTHHISQFLLTHLNTLHTKFQFSNSTYRSSILSRLQQLDINHEQYMVDRLKILSDSAIAMDIDYTLYYDPVGRGLGIRPMPGDIYGECMGQVRAFVREIDRIGFRIIRTEEFRFITKNVFKSGEEQQQMQDERQIFKYFLTSTPAYQPTCNTFQQCLQQCQSTFQSRISLFQPFLNLYLQYLEIGFINEHEGLNYQDIISHYEKIQQDLLFCGKLDEGEYFVVGFLKTSEFKKELVDQIRKKEKEMFKRIPQDIANKRNKLNTAFQKHLAVFNNQTSNASSFIKTGEQAELVEENLLEYSATIDEIDKIQQFYERYTKNKLTVLQDQKKYLQQLKIKLKTFIQSRETNFMKYRKSLQLSKTSLTKKTQLYSTKQDSFYDPQANAKQNYSKVSEITKSLKAIQGELSELNRLELFYNLKPTSFMSLDMLIKEYENLEDIWKFTANAEDDEAGWARKGIRDIPEQKYIKYYDVYRKRAQKYIKDTDLTFIATSCLKKVQQIIESMQTIQLITSPHLRPSDLQEINYYIERKLNIPELGTIKCRSLTYQKFKEFKISEMRLFIAEIVFKARKQIQIQQNIVKFNQWWKSIKLDHQNMQAYPNIIIFGQNLKLRDEIDEYMTMLINILNNKYGNFIRNQCNNLLKKLNNLAELLQLAEIHQEKFLNLFPILTSKYAELQLSAECKKFDTILTKTMKNIRVLVKPTQNLNQSTKNILNNHIKHFDSISSVLSKFLESKRLKFQRFYFLQDYQLLQVLVGIADEKNVFRMFEGIKGWLLADGMKIGVIGIGDEELVLKGWNYKNVEPELIFKSLEDAIKSNLNSIVRNVLYQYQVQLKELKDLYENIPWMCLYAVQLTLFTKQVELNCFHQQIPLSAQQALIREAVNHAIVKPSQYSNYITLLLHLLHFVEQMRKEEVNSIFNFQWHSFLRFYYDKDAVVMRAMSNEIRWGGQYQGMWNLMVYTSDIKRAHICVLNSVQYANGVLLQGPSGTGKTQSLKQLARCTAKYCVIFNCSQNVNLRTVSKLLSGLCYTASWLCLDQINRLTMQAMSTIAKQIQTIRNAILAKKQLFNFMGKDIKLRQGVAIFSTMNPIYLKRAKLTENIKSYFRIITVAMPEHENILQILLYGLKFYKPRELAKKIGNCFANLSIQLSKNAQYDFGLRAMKFLIGNLSKRRLQTKNQNQIIGGAFYDIFLYRLSPSDKPIFQKVIFDIFAFTPKQPQPATQARIAIMRESPQTGTIVFGPVSIKSRLIKQYCDSFKDSELHLYNPNSADMQYFLGGAVHGRWEEGVVEKVARQSLSFPQKMHILVLDSTLKSEIIENFNTLLDESKLLTLSNGTRLKIHSNLKILMQTQHLSLTSPSTITRCNVIYVCDRDVDTESLILAQMPVGLRESQWGKKIRKIYGRLGNAEIRDVGRLSKVMTAGRYGDDKGEWKESEALGVQKAVIFAIRILGLQDKIKQLINKDNSFHIKKSPFQHLLVYQRYAQGQFLQISRTYEPIIEYGNFTIKTSTQIFMKWLTRKATSRKMQPILWKGHTYQGKSKGLVFSLKGLKYTKICLDKSMSSSVMSHLLLPQILDRKNQEVKQTPELIIYLQNLHMANEQSSQQIRFMMENSKLFSIQAKQFVSIQALAFVAESRHFETKEFDRVRRHFSEVTIPAMDQIELKNVYYEILKYNIEGTNVEANLKNSINLQSERFCTFLAKIYEYRCLANQQSQHMPGPYEMVRVLNRAKYLNFNNCRQIGDFISFMFEAIKVEDRYGTSRSIVDDISQEYFVSYAGKFNGQAELYLKGGNILLKSFNTPIDSPKKDKQKQKQKKVKESNYTNLLTRLQQVDKNLYISKYFCQEVQIVFRILQTEACSFCYFGSEGSGRKTIFKTACKVAGYNFTQPPQQLTQKQIKRLYYDRMKKSVQSKTKQIFILDLKFPWHIKFIEFAQAVALGTSITHLFDPEETDYMFATITDYIDEYSKSSKSYEEVCQDYVTLAQNGIQLLIACPFNLQTEGLLESYLSLYKTLYIRTLPQYPIQSLVQCISNILSNKIKQNQSIKSSISIEILPRLFMKIYKVFNLLAIKNCQNGFYHFNFSQFHIFRLVEQFIGFYQGNLDNIKESQDVLNRSITKIGDIGRSLGKLKEEVEKTQPEVVSKRNRILEVVPVLQQKKTKMQSIKYALQSQRKQIQLKNDQISILMKQVQQQISQSTPLLNEAIDSIQTIKRTQLSELKNNPNPHPLLKFTLENMVILLGESSDWDTVRKILSDASLLVRIKACQPSEDGYQRVKKRVAENGEWTWEGVSKVSYGARYLYKWIKSIIKYKDIEHSIAKKKQYVQKLKLGLQTSQQKAHTKLLQLSSKEQDSEAVQKQYTKITKQLNDLEEMLANNRKKLINAQKIKSSLEDSFMGWEEKLRYLKDIRGNLEVYTLALCLELKLYPCLTTEQLAEIKKQVTKIFTQDASGIPKHSQTLLQMLTRSPTQKSPILHKFTPQDTKDPKKTMLAYHWSNYPLILDPDNQAFNWLGQLGLEEKFVFTRRTFLGAAKMVEDTMKYGGILVVLVDGEIDGFGKEILKSLAPLSLSSTQGQIEYNKNTFPLSPNFTLLFCCKSKNPSISLPTSLGHQVINFQITKLSLQQNLLRAALKAQKPELYEIKNKIQRVVGTTQKEILKMEGDILEGLMNTRKNLIEDESFIGLLQENKKKTVSLEAKKNEQQSHIQEIQNFMRQFEVITSEVADIFISIKEMSKINPNLVWDSEILVQYFLDACVNSISQVLENEGDEEIVLDDNVFGAFEFEEFHQSLSRPTTALSNVSLSLSRLASQQNQQQSPQQTPTHRSQRPQQQQQPPETDPTLGITNITNNATKFLFTPKTIITHESQKGQVPIERANKIVGYLLNWLKKGFTERERYVWALVLALKNQNKDDLRGLLTLMGTSGKKRNLQMLLDQNMLTQNLKAYFSKIQPTQVETQAIRIITQTDHLIGQLKTQPSIIEVLMLGQILQPENFLPLTKKIMDEKKYSTILEYEELRVADWLEGSDCMHPILLLMGEDPVQLISEYLERKKYKNATLVAIGEDQGRGLDQHIEKQCRKEGLFIIHNFHIATTFMPALTRLLQQFTYRPPHKNFRLILIGSLDTPLPLEIASLCHKYIVQQPSGLKNKMKDLYRKSESYIDHSIPSQHKLTYSLCLMHSIVNEMHRYGSLCWNFPPSYTTSDFISSLYAVKSICQKKQELDDFQCNIDKEEIEKELNHETIDYAGLRYLIGQTCYVGKMSDNIDRKKMRIIIDNHFFESIMRKNYACWQGSPLSDHPQQVSKCIEEIDEQSPKTCGLHQNAQPSRHLTDKILTSISTLYLPPNTLLKRILQMAQPQKFVPLEPVPHKLSLITEEINSYNNNGVYHPRSLLLKDIEQGTRVFNLRAFENPRQIFVGARLEVAMKSNVPYDGVVLVWSFVEKDGYYGVSNLNLEGGSIKNNTLVSGPQQKSLTLYFSAVLKKKDKDPNKGKVAIPLYLSEQRGQSIDNYGENTNLLTEVYVDSKEPGEGWVIRGTAFVVA